MLTCIAPSMSPIPASYGYFSLVVVLKVEAFVVLRRIYKCVAISDWLVAIKYTLKYVVHSR